MISKNYYNFLRYIGNKQRYEALIKDKYEIIRGLLFKRGGKDFIINLKGEVFEIEGKPFKIKTKGIDLDEGKSMEKI